MDSAVRIPAYRLVRGDYAVDLLMRVYAPDPGHFASWTPPKVELVGNTTYTGVKGRSTLSGGLVLLGATGWRRVMKTVLIAIAATLSAMSVLLLPACSSRNEAPDPVAVQEELAGNRNQELELVRATITDQERAERFVGLLNQRDKLVADYTKGVQQYRAEMAKLNANYDADRESFDSLIAGFNGRRAVAQEEFIDLAVAMKRETTPEEWKAISRFQLKKLDPRRLTYGRAAMEE
jgi:hypothetical protein